MLEIEIPNTGESFNEETGEFISGTTQSLLLEHSLLSLHKWEQKWCKPFLTKTEKTEEETIDYIKFMTISDVKDMSIYNRLTNENIEQISRYIESPMTATTVRDEKSGGSREIITSEIIYYWMISLNIPFECQSWHLNSLLMLIRVCNVKNSPGKKMSKREVLSRNRSINEKRRNAMHSKG